MKLSSTTKQQTRDVSCARCKSAVRAGADDNSEAFVVTTDDDFEILCKSCREKIALSYKPDGPREDVDTCLNDVRKIYARPIPKHCMIAGCTHIWNRVVDGTDYRLFVCDPCSFGSGATSQMRNPPICENKDCYDMATYTIFSKESLVDAAASNDNADGDRSESKRKKTYGVYCQTHRDAFKSSAAQRLRIEVNGRVFWYVNGEFTPADASDD